MRLQKLQLERYGPFTDVELVFRPGAQLHVVYGPNEAGKSCALAAVDDLLFGIEHRTAYDFLHEGKDMRIGAEIADRAGNALRIKRRKGNKGTLLDWETGAALPNEALSGFLGGLSRDTFRQAFGLNSTTLRSGAEEMLKADGDVGTSLFAAASGLRGLTDLRRRLDAEAEAIFTVHRSNKRTFYQALDRFEDARKAVRERELRATDWKALNEEINRLAGDVEDIKQRQAQARTDHARLARLSRVAPQIARIDHLAQRLADQGELPVVKPGFPRDLKRCLEARARAVREHELAMEEESRARAASEAIATDNRLLAQIDEIDALVADLGAYTKALKDLPGVEREIQAFDNELADLAARLGLFDQQSLVAARPTDTALALVRELLAEGNRLADEQANNSSELARVRDALTGLERQVGTVCHPVDPRLFAERFDALKPAMRRIERLDEQRVTAKRLDRRIDEAIARLIPSWQGGLEALAKAALPGSETIDAHARTFEELKTALARLDDRLDGATADRAKLERKLSSLTEDHPVPTADLLADSRANRDAIWQRLRAILFMPADACVPADVANDAAAFLTAMADADRQADEAIRDATRLAEHTALRRQLYERDAEIAQLMLEKQALTNATDREHAAWAALWHAVGVANPLAPVQMIRWLAAITQVLELREEALSVRDQLRKLDQEADWVGPRLGELAADISTECPAGMRLADMAEAVQLRMRQMGEAWTAHRERDIQLKSARAQQKDCERRAADLEARKADWSQRWGAATSSIGLGQATRVQGETALALWQVVPAKLAERSNRVGRVVGMRDYNAAYAAKVASVLRETMPDLAALPTEAAVMKASAHGARAREQVARRAEAQKRLEAAAEVCAAAQSALSAAEQDLTSLAQLLPPTEDMAALCGQLAQREELTTALGQQRLQLAEQADGMAEAEIRAELAARDPDRASADLKELEELQTRLEDDIRERYAAWKSALARREALEHGTGAEEDATRQRSAEADLAMHSRDWSILKIGALLLGAAIERQRSTQHDPMMARASVLFAMLSDGSFDGLLQELDDNDVPHLVGLRRSGVSVHVKAMSEGARDQLYLALRLAYLEDFASRSDPPPFIGDDLFMTFDDNRARCGISALAELSGRLQPIVFTHHRHLVDIAREALGDKLDELRLG